jgi:hypothetical protein
MEVHVEAHDLERRLLRQDERLASLERRTRFFQGIAFLCFVCLTIALMGMAQNDAPADSKGGRCVDLVRARWVEIVNSNGAVVIRLTSAPEENLSDQLARLREELEHAIKAKEEGADAATSRTAAAPSAPGDGVIEMNSAGGSSRASS